MCFELGGIELRQSVLEIRQSTLGLRGSGLAHRVRGALIARAPRWCPVRTPSALRARFRHAGAVLRVRVVVGAPGTASAGGRPTWRPVAPARLTRARKSRVGGGEGLDAGRHAGSLHHRPVRRSRSASRSTTSAPPLASVLVRAAGARSRPIVSCTRRAPSRSPAAARAASSPASRAIAPARGVIGMLVVGVWDVGRGGSPGVLVHSWYGPSAAPRSSRGTAAPFPLCSPGVGVVVPVRGFEPRLEDSKSSVLPLDDTGALAAGAAERARSIASAGRRCQGARVAGVSGRASSWSPASSRRRASSWSPASSRRRASSQRRASSLPPASSSR